MRKSLTVVALTALSSPAAADLGISARTAGMGGTGVASSRGGEAMFYNPALTLTATNAEISVSASAYGYEAVNYRDFYSIDDGRTFDTTDAKSSNLMAFPSAISTLYPFKAFGLRQVAGVGVFVPSASDFSADALFSPTNFPTIKRFSLEFALHDYRLTGSYAVMLGPVALGLAVIGSIDTEKTRSSISNSQPGSTPASAPFSTQYSSLDGKSVGLRLQAGAHIQLGELGIGATFLTSKIPIAGTGTYSVEFGKSDPNGNFFTSAHLDGVGYEGGEPGKVALGLSYERPRSFMLAADFNLSLPATIHTLTFDGPIPLGSNQPALEPDAFVIENALTFNASIGAEIAVTDSWWLRAGFFTAFPKRAPLISDEDILRINDRLAMNLSPEEFQQIFKEYDSAQAVRANRYGATLGLSIKHESVQTDFALTGILDVGERISQSNTLTPEGRLIDSLSRTQVDGFAVIISVGGTLDIEQKKEDEE